MTIAAKKKKILIIIIRVRNGNTILSNSKINEGKWNYTFGRTERNKRKL
jgi:hypothetical protein